MQDLALQFRTQALEEVRVCAWNGSFDVISVSGWEDVRNFMLRDIEEDGVC